MNSKLHNTLDIINSYEHNPNDERGLPSEPKNRSVKRYNGLINKKGGYTSHYDNSRILREQEFKNLIGDGIPLDVFIVKDKTNGEQIQEVRDNGIIIIYSLKTHKKITTFTPNVNRLSSLYEAIGEVLPADLVIKSEHNVNEGYNSLFA